MAAVEDHHGGIAAPVDVARHGVRIGCSTEK
jgi:hypothetical protein